MSFFSEVNRDALSVDPQQVSPGPRLGFLDAWTTAYEAQVRGSALYGIENAFLEEDQAQAEAVRRAGGNPVYLGGDFQQGVNPGLLETSVYLDAARAFQSGDEPSESVRNRLRSYDENVSQLRAQVPGVELRTSREMWDTVRQKAQRAESREANLSRTFGGSVGGFLGGAVASLDPRTDPLNFATLGVGGAGRTAAARIATEAGAQGAVETLNQITGVQEQRDLLGLSTGLGDALTRVGAAAVGGAAVRGLAEGAGYAARRWFTSTPEDPAPPAPASPGPLAAPAPAPASALADVRAGAEALDAALRGPEAPPALGPARVGRPREAADLVSAASQLERWDGPAPWEMTPRGDTSTLAYAEPGRANFALRVDADAVGDSVDTIARKIDPDIFRVYDNLVTRRDTYRRWLDELAPARSAEIAKVEPELDAQIKTVTDEIQRLSVRIPAASKRLAKKYEARIAELQQQRALLEDQWTAASESVRGIDTADMARVRKELVKTDERMRDLAPSVSRAYAQARNQWSADAPLRDQVAQMIQDGARSLPSASRFADLADELPTAFAAARSPGVEAVPSLAARPDIVAAASPADTLADLAGRAIADEADAYERQLDEALADLKGQAEQLDEIGLPDDAMNFVDDAGNTVEMTPRQALAELERDNAELESLVTCSIKPRS